MLLNWSYSCQFTDKYFFSNHKDKLKYYVGQRCVKKKKNVE